VIASASFLQQIGIRYVPSGKTGFLTALYIVIVPLLGIFFKRKTAPVLWLAVILAMCGTWFLCGGLDSFGTGELLIIACAFVYSLHILVIDHYAAKCDCVRLSCLQFVTAAVLSGLFSLFLGESWAMESIRISMPYWMFCGLGSSAVAFTLQMYAQKHLHPATASLLRSLESVFAVICGNSFLGERVSDGDLAGYSLIFLGIILAQFPQAAKKE
jgi:drug/metabolite transporter (DMT)-like permease